MPAAKTASSARSGRLRQFRPATISRPAGQNELPYYLLDGGIAMSHIHLVADELGQKPAWITDPTALEPVRTESGIPAAFDVIGALKLPA